MSVQTVPTVEDASPESGGENESGTGGSTYSLFIFLQGPDNSSSLFQNIRGKKASCSIGILKKTRGSQRKDQFVCKMDWSDEPLLNQNRNRCEYATNTKDMSRTV